MAKMFDPSPKTEMLWWSKKISSTLMLEQNALEQLTLESVFRLVKCLASKGRKPSNLAESISTGRFLVLPVNVRLS